MDTDLLWIGGSKEHWKRDVHGQRITRSVLRSLG